EKEYKRVVGPILGVIKKEIENYAVRNKVSMVLDKKERGVLYVDNFSDISTLILEKVKKNYKKE
ncbi:MAG: OmpH family outer membrane protein, partial [Flavobacteriales bacterium]|nr:OmpH family outer membrane protein [Flavobacteriales bacterium]